MPPTLDGSAVFGYAVSVAEQPTANVHQLNEFFGVNGQQSLFGGTRGRTFLCTGTLMATSLIGIEFAKQQLESFADGLTHQLVDSNGIDWPNVIMVNDRVWTTEPRVTAAAGFGNGYGRRYRLTLLGLT